MSPLHPRSRKKRQVFFVDTKSTCFLCLQDSLPDPPPNSEVECVEPEVPQEPFSLQGIFKLLQLDAGQVLSKKLTEGPLLGFPLVNTDLSVVLCANCRQVSSQLTSMFREWEVLRRRMNHAVEDFSEILDNSQRDPSHVAQLRRNLLDPLELFQSSVAELIRKETLTRCKEHLQKFSQPTVTLPGTPNPPVPAPGVPVGPPVPASNVIVRKLPLKTYQRPAQPTTTTQVRQPLNCGTGITLSSQRRPSVELTEEQPPAKVPRPVSSIPLAQQEDLKVPLFCGLCPPADATENFKDTYQLKKHMYAHHPDYFFVSFKQAEWTQVQFRELCDNLLQEEVLRGATKPTTEGAVVFNCITCRRKFPDQPSMVAHLVECHRRIFGAQLKKLQDTNGTVPVDDPAEKTGNRGSPAVTPTSVEEPTLEADPVFQRHCTNCGEKFPNASTMLDHQAQTCSYRSLNPASSNAPSLFQCRECLLLFSRLTDLRQHVASVHTSNAIRGRGGFCKCGRYYANLKKHLSNPGCPAQKEKTPEYDTGASANQVTLHCENCGATFSTPQGLGRHKKKHCPYQMLTVNYAEAGSVPPLKWKDGAPLVFRCFDCHIEFPHFPGLREHIASTHGQNEFPKKTGRGGTCDCGVYYARLRRHILSQNCSAHGKTPDRTTARTPSTSRDCDKSMTTNWSLPRHQRRNRTSAKVVADRGALPPQPAVRALEPPEEQTFVEEEMGELRQPAGIYNPAEIEVFESSPLQIISVRGAAVQDGGRGTLPEYGDP